MEKTGENHHEIALACPDCGRVGSIVDGAASYICPGCGRLWDEQSVESWNKLGWPRPEWVLKDGGRGWGGRLPPVTLRNDEHARAMRLTLDQITEAIYRRLYIPPAEAGRDLVRAVLETESEDVHLQVHFDKDLRVDSILVVE
jgi:DNA-directed RNA polymerase subunit RPC12/RpoP